MTTPAPSIAEARADRAELRSAVGTFLEHVHPVESARDLQGDEPFDRATWARLAGELDLLGVRVDPQHGGQGLSFAYSALVAEELGRRLVPSAYLASVGLATELISHLATDEQRSRWLPRLVDGSLVATCVLATGAAGVDLTATRRGEEVVVDGVASFVLQGADADLVLVEADLDGRTGVFVVEGNADGLDRASMATVDRTRKQAQLTFESCAGEPLGVLTAASSDAGVHVLRRVRLEVCALVAVEAVGAAEACLAGALAYVGERRQFGQPVGSFQGVQHELADLHGEVQSARAAVDRAVDVLDQQPGARLDIESAVAVAALRSGEALERVARQGLHLHGGIGFTWEHTSHLFLKRALGDRSLIVPRDYHRSQLSDAMFGSSLGVPA